MSKIIIEADNPDDLYAIMKQLLHGAGGSLVHTATASGVAGPVTKTEAVAAATRPKPEPVAEPAAAAAPTPSGDAKTDKMAAARAAKAAKQQAGQPASAQTAEPAAQAAQPAAAVVATKPASKPASAVGLPELPDTVKGTSSMRDLLTYLSEHGVGSVDAMVDACKALKDVVPILGKVPDVEQRVRRAVEVLGLFATDGASEASA